MLQLALSEVAAILSASTPAGTAEVTITGICTELSRLHEGDLFVSGDHNELAQAAAHGAAAVLVPHNHDQRYDIPTLAVSGLEQSVKAIRSALAATLPKVNYIPPLPEELAKKQQESFFFVGNQPLTTNNHAEALSGAA